MHDVRAELRASGKAQPLEGDALARIAESLDGIGNVRAWFALTVERTPSLAHLAERVGPAGRVVAVDLDALLAELAADGRDVALVFLQELDELGQGRGGAPDRRRVLPHPAQVDHRQRPVDALFGRHRQRVAFHMVNFTHIRDARAAQQQPWPGGKLDIVPGCSSS